MLGLYWKGYVCLLRGSRSSAYRHGFVDFLEEPI